MPAKPQLYTMPGRKHKQPQIRKMEVTVEKESTTRAWPKAGDVPDVFRHPFFLFLLCLRDCRASRRKSHLFKSPFRLSEDDGEYFGEKKIEPKKRGKTKRFSVTLLTMANIWSINLVFIFRCSSSPSNPVYARRVDSSALGFSLSSHRHSYIGFVFSSRFIHS
jgi:hypothetical protein